MKQGKSGGSVGTTDQGNGKGRSGGMTVQGPVKQRSVTRGAEAHGQQKQSNDPGNNQHIPNTPIVGRR